MGRKKRERMGREGEEPPAPQLEVRVGGFIRRSPPPPAPRLSQAALAARALSPLEV